MFTSLFPARSESPRSIRQTSTQRLIARAVLADTIERRAIIREITRRSALNEQIHGSLA